MLQPRLQGLYFGMASTFVVAVLILNSIVSCQELSHDEHIDSSRIKRENVPENRDLTVLLVNEKRNDYNTKIGRYHSVKPLIGLLTSTARTFIQDGVTTEFATQILGTTLDNGRIYAQLLTKSSLVLYNKPTNVEDPVVVQPTRVHSAFDGEWNVKQDLGFIDPEKFVLKNTDYLAPNSKMDIVYASKHIQEPLKFWSPTAPENQFGNQVFEEPVARRVQPVKEIPRYAQNEVLNYLDGPSVDSDKKVELVVETSMIEHVNSLHRQNKANELVTEPVKTDSNDDLVESNVSKVKPNYDLPTFTIKNEFSPIFYYIDNVESRRTQQQPAMQSKTPKKLFGQKSEPRPKTTFTYAGFADFTTVVGDTVIIFSPNTEKPQNPDEVNVFPSAKPVDKLATKVTFLASDIPVASSTYKAHEVPVATKISVPAVIDEHRSDKALFNDEKSLKEVLYEVDKMPDSISVQYNNGFDLNADVIQSSESPVILTESTRTTDGLGVIPIQDQNSYATEPLGTLTPSSTVIDSPKESAVTERDMTDMFTNSEEESENTAAEVTEPTEEEDEQEEATTEPQDFKTTTESGNSGELSEELETTTEFKYLLHETNEEDSNEGSHEFEVCTQGLETLSTMTTAYKTLTYLTTYFIPLQSTETTTSIKSDVVVESNVGYLTNVVCKTNLNIEPTGVVSVDINYSAETKSQILEVSEEHSSELAPKLEVTTEQSKATTQQDISTSQEQKDVNSKEISENSNESVSNEERATNKPITTTTEQGTTPQTRVEMSVTTEQTTTTTTTTTEKAPEEEVQEQENEIDVIYKTLYTTYTYFTTFFGDHTSSVASHKSVVTNTITSTVDLSKLDPSLLGAFNEDEIAPTNVGAGRPTDSFAINSIIDLVKNKDVIESVENGDIYSSQTPTPSLSDDVVASIKPDAVKTYYTTYTFFTTIYVGTDANVCSRSEIYTNYVGPGELIPTKTNPLPSENTRAQFDFRNCKQVKMQKPASQEDTSSMEKSVSMEEKDAKSEESKSENTPEPTPIEVDMLFSVESNPLVSENSYVTDVKSSSSKGERKILDNNNIILDDQISSESNIEEIMPSPTLLLQTSYTTFTYFTTMYIGKDSSKVKSRLETITNVVTETIMPNKEPEEESNLPITYYTTFTYWTTLYKDKSTTITSREEIVSNVITPLPQALATVSPIDTTPIDIDSVLPPKELEIALKPSVIEDNLETDDGKATFYTTYTYFTTFYTGNTSQIRSSLETVTNIVDNTKLVDDNQLGRKVSGGAADQNLIQGDGEKPHIEPTIVKEQIIPTKLPDASSIPPTVLLGTYIDNLFAEVKPNEKSTTSSQEGEKKILFSQVAVISGDSSVVTSDNKSLNVNTTSTSSPSTSTSTEASVISPAPDVIESSEPTTEVSQESEEDDDNINTRKKSRLTFTPKKPSTTPVIIPFASRNRPTFIPKRVPLSSSATTITRADFTPPVITATPSLKSVKASGYNGNRKQPAFSGSSSAGKRFPGRSSSVNLSSNIPSASRSGGFGSRGNIQPSSRRTGFRSSSVRASSLDYITRSASPRVRPTASSRFPGRNIRPSASITYQPDQNEETLATGQEENATEALEEVTEASIRTTNNPLSRFRRPPIARQPGAALTPRTTTSSSRRVTPRGRVTTTTRRSTTRPTTNPLLSLRRQRPNALFPKRNLFKQPEPEPQEDIKEDEQKVDDNEEILVEEDLFEEDNDYDSSDRRERQVVNPPTSTPKRNIVQIRPFAFRRRSKRQVDYGNRKYNNNFRRPGTKPTTRRVEPEYEEPTTQKQRVGKQTTRFNGRTTNLRTTTAPSTKSSGRQPFIVRGESRTTTTTSSPAYRRGKTRPSSRTTTSASRPKAPRLNSNTRSSTTRNSASGRSRPRTTTSRASSRQRGSFENISGERFNYKNALDDGKVTVTHQVPTEVTVPVVNGKITEYKNLLSATPSIETLLSNQIITTYGPLGNPQLIIASESTELAENGATKIIKYVLHETPTTTVIFTPTTIRGRKTSFSHVLPSTVYNVEYVTQTIAPEINANVPLANLLLSQLLLGNQQPAINPLLALQGQGLIPQQAVPQTPVTEYKTRTTTYVTTVTDARETVLPITFKAFNTNGIIYDNTPWRPGRDIDPVAPEEDERKLKNLATRVMSNGVEVLVKDKNADGKQEQRKFNFIHESTPQLHISSTPTKKLLSSAVATVVSRQQISALYPLHRLMQHNYIIKTCMTTYTYLTTVVHNKRSAISTFETIVSVVTTESLTNLYASDVIPDLKPTKTKYMEVKTIKPSAATNMYMSNYPKIDKRIDSEEENSDNFDIIQPSEASSPPCTSSCSCSHTRTEGLKTKYTLLDNSGSGTKTKFSATKLDLRPTNIESSDKKTHYAPYEYESNTNSAPTDTIVEKYTEVINDYSDEKDSNSVEESELLTNEQAPIPPKTNKISTKLPEKSKPEKPQKPNKNKFVVADLLKLGSLGIKGLSQLAPVLEKMTGGFIRRHDTVNKTTSTTIKPAAKLTAYNMNKRVDSDVEAKHTNFPIYIPVDELDTAESQTLFTNATLHQNFAWALEHKQPKAHIVLPKIVHESPLVNGGIPISPGEIITANSDVIVGKPAVGGPLTLAASGIKLQNSVKPPPIDSFYAANDHYAVNEIPLNDQAPTTPVHVDDSYDLRPPEPPKPKPKPNRPMSWSKPSYNTQNMPPNDQYPYRMPSSIHDQLMKTEQIKTSILGNHGRPAFLDYIPSLGKPTTPKNIDTKANEPIVNVEVSDNSPSSSEVVNTKITTNGDYSVNDDVDSGKPFLVDIQPSRVANVLIPHGSTTALVFAGSSEPHKTGDYIDDPLPYPEPGYFGSFSIDAPQLTNVHNVAPTRNKQTIGKPSTNPHTESNYKPTPPIYKENSVRNDFKIKWHDNKRPIEYNKIPPPTSNQETHVQVGPEITVYNPDIYNPSNDDFNKYKLFNNKDKRKDGKNIIDKEYENYLAVPPPPQQSKTSFDKDIYDKSKPYSQRPIVHTKPVQDMKVFLNIQHPVPEQLPPKVTSEIYFAAQMPNNKPTPSYTIQIPSSPQNPNSHQSSNMQPPKFTNNAGHNNGNTFSIVSSPNIANVTVNKLEKDYKDNSYSVTLNTATNVLSNSDAGQVVGSSISVPIGNSNSDTNNQLNTNIPIGTNFAIRVEDNSTPLENFNLQGHQTPNVIYSEHSLSPHVTIGDNRWNKSSSDNSLKVYNYHSDNYEYTAQRKPTNSNVNSQSVNSHANFPMMNENITPINEGKTVKPVIEYTDNIKSSDITRPAKLTPKPTNSHGWYSSMLNENKINNIKVEATTRRIIPLITDFNSKDNPPNFGQKITSVGKPPTDFWSQSSTPTEVNNDKTSFIIGKPFTKQRPSDIIPSSVPPFASNPYTYNYIPSNFGGVRQPTYDIPIRDNSEETTTLNPKATTVKVKPVNETSEEVYDGEEEGANPGEIDGEISSESMKIPVVSASKEVDNVSSTSTEITLLNDEVTKVPNKNDKEDENKVFVTFNPGTQTEKPFRSHNKTTFQSNAIKPIYENINYNKPRPFKINPAIVLDHQLQQPHWQINQMVENATNMSYEDNIDLNIGEEMDKSSFIKPTSTSPKPIYTVLSEVKYKKPSRPNFSRPNNTNVRNESIITSTVHIQDKKPLMIEKETEKPSLPTFTLSNLEINRTSSEIIDLSPPPPTMDYNFKPSTNDEMIMGMSPPPPRNPPGIRVPARVPMTPRTPVIPIRTPPPYKAKPSRLMPTRTTTQRPVRKPINRDEVSTYRPAYDILNNVRRPIYNRDQPSLQLLPPPRDLPSKAVSPVREMVTPTTDVQDVPNVVFPTPISSGWLTSSGIDFSSSFNFNPSSVKIPETPQSSKFPEFVEKPAENSFSYEATSEENHDTSSEKSVTEDRFTVSKESSSESTTTDKNISNNESNDSSQASQEESSPSDVKIIIGNKNRTRKPYPVRYDEKKTVTSKHKLPPKPTPIIKPTKTFSRHEILYPTRHTSIKKIVRPVTRTPTVSPTIIESSEQPVDEDFIKPTETLKDNIEVSIPKPESSIINFNDLPNDLPSITSSSIEEITIKPTHHAGNEVKISDEILPTKTEFRTTVITLTKTLSEPPLTISSIGYVNLTHTLTVTATKTSLVSQSEGAVTQTLVLTNTQTSTIVDVVTEVHTQVQPTTIIETVTRHIPIQVQPTPVQEISSKTKIPLDDITMSSEENENLIIKDSSTTEKPIQKIENEPEPENDSDTFFVVMNKSQNGGQAPPIATNDVDADYDITRNEQLNNNGVSQVLFGEILLAGTPFLETTNLNPNGVLYNKECQPDCKASRNERCQRIDGLMKCVCRPGFARMFPDRPCKPTYTYSVKLALGSQGNERLEYHKNLSDNSSKEYHALAVATHEGINRMVMQSDLRDVYHGVHITGFDPVELKGDRGELYKGVMNHFYVQLSDNAHESRLKEVVEKYLRNNNYSLGGTEVYAASGLMDKLDVSDFDECVSGQFHDCSEHAQCFNLRGTYTCSCLEGFADLSVNTLYPGRICSAEPVGCERCNYHGACYSRDDRRVLCECFQWYSGSSCQINLKVVLISLVVCGALLTAVLAVCAVLACSKRRRPPHPQRSIVACIQGMPSIHQGAVPSKQRADRRALISERGESGDTSSIQNASLPYIPAKKASSCKKTIMSDPPAHDPPPPPAPAVMIPRARLHPHHSDSRENIARKRSIELSNEAKLISYLESGVASPNDEMRRKHSLESSYSANKDRHNKQGALVSAGFKVSTTIRPDEAMMKDDRDSLCSVNKGDLEAELSRYDAMRKSYSQEDMSEWTDAERRLGELTLSEARSVGGTLPASTGRAASSTRLTHQTSDVSEFDSL